jgi:hypothetical protein
MAFGSEEKETGFSHRFVMAGLIRVDRRMALPRADMSDEDVYRLPVLMSKVSTNLSLRVSSDSKTYGHSSPKSPSQVDRFLFPGITPNESSGLDMNVCCSFKGSKTFSCISSLKSLPVILSAICERSVKPKSEYVGVVKGAKDGGRLFIPSRSSIRVHAG